MIWVAPSSCAKDLTISEGTGAKFLFNFHSRVSIYFHAPETSKHEMDKFLLSGTHTRKRIMVAPPSSKFPIFAYLSAIFITVLALCPTVVQGDAEPTRAWA
jgi:hypothetical protein